MPEFSSPFMATCCSCCYQQERRERKSGGRDSETMQFIKKTTRQRGKCLSRGRRRCIVANEEHMYSGEKHAENSLQGFSICYFLFFCFPPHCKQIHRALYQSYICCSILRFIYGIRQEEMKIFRERVSHWHRFYFVQCEMQEIYALNAGYNWAWQRRD